MLQEMTKENNSPFNTLLSEFSKQQDQFREIIRTLETTGHRLSNTDYPTETAPEKGIAATPALPFNEGNLMRFHMLLNENRDSLQRLSVHVNKISGLI